MRQRKRPDWPQRVYRYDVRIADEAVPILLRHAALMADTWNLLCAAWAEHRQRASADDLKQALWNDWHEHMAILISASGLNWSDQAALRDRFLRALKGGGPRPKTGPLVSVCALHRFTGGGLPVRRIFHGHGSRFRLQPSDHRRRTCGQIIILGQPIPLQVTLHRQPPEGSLLKAVQLVGRQVLPTVQAGERLYPPRWAWQLCLTIEEPPPLTVMTHRSPHTAAIDLNWRRIGEGDDARIRVGVLVDEAGQVITLEYPATFLTRAKHLRELQSRKDMTSGAVRYRACREWRLAQRHLLRAREWLWRNWARRLCEQYGRLILEDMNLSTMLTHEAPTGGATCHQAGGMVPRPRRTV